MKKTRMRLETNTYEGRERNRSRKASLIGEAGKDVQKEINEILQMIR